MESCQWMKSARATRATRRRRVAAATEGPTMSDSVASKSAESRLQGRIIDMYRSGSVRASSVVSRWAVGGPACIDWCQEWPFAAPGSIRGGRLLALALALGRGSACDQPRAGVGGLEAQRGAPLRRAVVRGADEDRHRARLGPVDQPIVQTCIDDALATDASRSTRANRERPGLPDDRGCGCGCATHGSRDAAGQCDKAASACGQRPLLLDRVESTILKACGKLGCHGPAAAATDLSLANRRIIAAHPVFVFTCSVYHFICANLARAAAHHAR